jgi:hypothetical protein
MHLYVWLFRAEGKGLSSRDNDIPKKNIDILKSGAGKAGSPMGLEPQPRSYFIICKAGTPRTLRPHRTHASFTGAAEMMLTEIGRTPPLTLTVELLLLFK